MEAPRQQRFLIVESDTRYAQWLQHVVGAGWPGDAIVIMDWTSFGRVRTAMTTRDYDVVMLSLAFDEGIEDPTTEGFEWIRRLRGQSGFPEMIILAEGGSELVAVRTLRMGAADYLPKRLLTPSRLQRSLKITLRAIEKRQAALQAKAPAGATPATASTASTAATAGSDPLPPFIATHTGASLAQAAQLAVTGGNLAPIRSAMAAPAAIVAPATHISTHTGASLAKAASAAVATPTTPRPAPAPAPAMPVETDRAASSLPTAAPLSTALASPMSAVPSAPTIPPAAQERGDGIGSPAAQTSGSYPLVIRESKPVAPENHHIPGYTILQRIGESEAAAVYLAISEDLGHNVALKISKRRYSGSSDDTGQRAIMFQREFEAIAALDHPSIIDLYDYGIHEGVEYLAMEYFPCGDLKARLQNPLTADEAIAFVKEIARSLKIVHDAGIIHRDLKPPNVMLRDDGSVVLIDFGLARSLLAGDGSTRTGVLRGSPYYMSPEQAQGEALDARTDLYSLGVILYEMLAGRKPYLGSSAIDVLQQHVMAPVPELPVHHLAYQPLLERLMSKSREQRIASCDELLSALEQMRLGQDAVLLDPAALVTASVGS
jgi:tRNA A-37 threonylcarbamoyl transferase component Bud32/DNA-binding response OmpR family regulator